MTITSETLVIARTMRIKLDATVDQATRDLAAAWSGAWDEIADEWAEALDELVQLADGDWPTQVQINRARRAQKAMQAAREQLDDLGRLTGIRILRDVSQLAADAALWEERLAVSQLPGSLTVDWSRVDADALAAIVRRTSQQVTASTRPLPAHQQAVMRQTLMRGITVGDNPRQAASLMLARLEGVFDGGRRRAETIARTELLDATRAAAHGARMANSDVLRGWMWMATKSARTCPACLAMDGQVFDLGTPGPEGHPSCRCTAAPLTKSMRDLGFDVDEPVDIYQAGRDWFDEQPEKVQAAIMGPERLRRLRDGSLSWDDIPLKKSNPGWRDSIGIRPLNAA